MFFSLVCARVFAVSLSCSVSPLGGKFLNNLARREAQKVQLAGSGGVPCEAKRQRQLKSKVAADGPTGDEENVLHERLQCGA